MHIIRFRKIKEKISSNDGAGSTQNALDNEYVT